ncbi:MAG TPA: hypothetical protein V6D00_06385 [Pantanalinema sp.]
MRLATLFTAALALALGAGSAQAAGHDHASAHDHHGAAAHAPAPLALDHGRKWATDAPLRQAMTGIHDAYHKAHTAQQAKSFTPEAARATAHTVKDRIDFMVANCKLSPKADANLHVLVADMLGAAEALETSPTSKDGLPRLRHALERYPRYFSHPGW